jgi:preprotein translocase subunit SecF
MIYLAIRFEWRFGVAAVIATAHDIMLTLGLIALLRIEVALPTVAAVLTIVGYSLNDTIVIFDRIRENLATTGGARLHRHRSLDQRHAAPDRADVRDDARSR